MNTFLVGLAVLLLAITGIAIGAGTPYSPPLHPVPALLTERWTASDKPYTGVVNELNERHTRGESLEPLVQKYKALAYLHPADPVAQFASICADYALFRSKNVDAETPWSLVERLQQADPGNVHQFARGRLMMSLHSGQSLSLPQVILVGNRLLRYDPKDEAVRKSLIDYLVDKRSGTDSAVCYAVEGVKLEPQSDIAHSSLALAYQTVWASDRKNRAYAPKAVAEYEAYLRLARADDPFRKHAQYLISVIKDQAGL